MAAPADWKTLAAEHRAELITCEERRALAVNAYERARQESARPGRRDE